MTSSLEDRMKQVLQLESKSPGIIDALNSSHAFHMDPEFPPLLSSAINTFLSSEPNQDTIVFAIEEVLRFAPLLEVKSQVLTWEVVMNAMSLNEQMKERQAERDAKASQS